ncbi:MAG: PAS domain S-box protein [Chthoniobacteraceae bacterium]|jgi:PAS domain S-box-containing protein
MSDPTGEILFSENDLFENAFNHAAIGMALVGLKGQFLKVNRSLCELVGYPAEELTKLTFQEITHADDLEVGVTLLKQMTTGEISNCRTEKRYMTRRGEVVWVLCTASSVPGDGGVPVLYIVQMEDITARKAAEDGLRQTLAERERLLEEVQRSHSEIVDLRSKLLTICAWTKQVRCKDRWMPVDEFLVNELGLNLTHGMSADAEAKMMKEEGGSC